MTTPAGTGLPHASADLNRMATTALRDSLVACLGEVGFRRRGTLFERFVDDGLVHLVQAQKSRSSTRDRVEVTVNLAVWVPHLSLVRFGRGLKPSVAAAVLSQRLGLLSPEKKDLWWAIETTADLATVPRLVARCVQDYALPVFENARSLAAVRALCDLGPTPWLMEHQRDFVRRSLGGQAS